MTSDDIVFGERFFKEVSSWSSKEIAIQCKKKIDEYERTREGRVYAEGYFFGNLLQAKNGGSSFFNDLERFKSNFEKMQNISAPSILIKYFLKGNVFSMSSEVYSLLENTSNKIFVRKSPFPIFAIDQNISVAGGDLEIIFSIFEGGMTIDGLEGCNYLAIGKDNRDSSEIWITGTVRDEADEKEFEAKGGILDYDNDIENLSDLDAKEMHKSIKLLYSNFLDYLNHPFAKQTIFRLSKNNEKREKRKKMPLQDKFFIDIKPEFLEYRNIKSNETGGVFKNKFWVRGHFKHFRNKDRYRRLYSLEKNDLEKEKLFINGEFVSKWIIPYIKGSGEIKKMIRIVK